MNGNHILLQILETQEQMLEILTRLGKVVKGPAHVAEMKKIQDLQARNQDLIRKVKMAPAVF